MSNRILLQFPLITEMVHSLEYIRSHTTGLQAATHTFFNPKKLHRVTIIGVQHVAHDDFWDEINNALTEADEEGAIHFEGVAPSNNVTDPLLKDKIAVFNAVLHHVDNLPELLNLTHQKDRIDRSRFKNGSVHDTDIQTVVSEMNFFQYQGVKLLLAAVNATGGNLSTMTPDFPEKMFKTIMDRKTNSKAGFDVLRLQSFAKKHMLEARNTIAVNAAVKEDKDVTLLWGAAHTPGIGAQLESAGYVLIDTMWRTVIPADHKIRP